MTLTEGRLALVRHGATKDNIAGRLMGANNAPLVQEALYGAEVLGATEEMRELLAGAASIISSPLCRAVQTAERLVVGLDLPVDIDPAFCERAFGCYDGQLLEELTRDLEWPRFEAGFTDRPEGGESLADVEARVFPRLLAVDAQTTRERNLIVVGHSTVWRLVTQALFGRRSYPLVEPIARPLSVQVFDRALIRELTAFVSAESQV